MSAPSRPASLPLALAALGCALPLVFLVPLVTVHVLAFALGLAWLFAALRFASFAQRARHGRLSEVDGRPLRRLAGLPWLAALATPVLVLGLSVGVAGDGQASRATILAKALSEFIAFGAVSFVVPLPVTLLVFAATRRLVAPPADAPESF